MQCPDFSDDPENWLTVLQHFLLRQSNISSNRTLEFGHPFLAALLGWEEVVRGSGFSFNFQICAVKIWVASPHWVWRVTTRVLSGSTTVRAGRGTPLRGTSPREENTADVLRERMESFKTIKPRIGWGTEEMCQPLLDLWITERSLWRWVTVSRGVRFSWYSFSGSGPFCLPFKLPLTLLPAQSTEQKCETFGNLFAESFNSY